MKLRPQFFFNSVMLNDLAQIPIKELRPLFRLSDARLLNRCWHVPDILAMMDFGRGGPHAGKTVAADLDDSRSAALQF